jgi:outer membrane lipoprotein carrier protein
MHVKTLIISFLIISQLTFAQDVVNEGIILLDEVRKDLSSLSANFEQYEINAADITSEKSTGKVWLKTPDQFKWEYQKPIPQLIVASGKKVWIYDEDLEQVTIKRQNSKQNPIYVLLDKQQTEANYIIGMEQQKADTNKMKWVKLLPKEPSDEVKVVWLGVKNNNLTILKLKDQLDNIVVFEFNKIKRNPKIEADFFEFKIPKGTDVLSEIDQIGEF